MMRVLALLLLLASPAWAQQYPPEAQPLTPPTRVLWVEVVPDVPMLAADATTQIDVLYVIASSYTTSQTTADTLCAQMITKGNEVLANDPAGTSRLNLVGCKLITYTSVSDSADLQAITNPSTGVLYAQVNTWRNQFGADVVQMIGTFTNSCGLGYQCTPNFGPQWAYSVVQGSCAVSNYSSVHEIGHNVCLAHDLPNQNPPSFTYGSGFCDPAGRRDPMSYPGTQLSPNACSGSRVSYHGNPDISPFGAPFGTTLNYNNARVWREQAAAVAAFRAPVVPPTCGTITLSPATLANGYTGRAYSQLWTATGGTGPYTFAVTAGTVPAGTTFTTATLSGTPTTAGASIFTVRATDSLACTGSTAYTLTILQLPSAPTNLMAAATSPARGPQSTITCPVGAVAISTSASIQTAINANVGATTFCLAAGIHPITAAIAPKSGNTFIGAFGAIIDGSGWVSSDNTQGAFRAHNVTLDSVTIKNLVIRNMPQDGFHFFGASVTNWTLDNNEITATLRAVNIGTGVAGTSATSRLLRNNYIHHNTSGGYVMFFGNGATFDNNEIAYNGTEQKITATQNVTFSNNFVHNNTQDGIWFDTQNTGYLIDGNTVTDQGRFGIHSEISGQGVISNNTVTRANDTGIMIVMSKSVEIKNNTIIDCFRGIQYYLKCSLVGTHSVELPPDGYQLEDNSSHDNTMTVPTTSGAWSSALGWPSADGACSAAYTGLTKNLTFTHNAYFVPNVSLAYWQWGLSIAKTFTQWQAIPQDATGSVTIRP